MQRLQVPGKYVQIDVFSRFDIELKQLEKFGIWWFNILLSGKVWKIDLQPVYKQKFLMQNQHILDVKYESTMKVPSKCFLGCTYPCSPLPRLTYLTFCTNGCFCGMLVGHQIS